MVRTAYLMVTNPEIRTEGTTSAAKTIVEAAPETDPTTRMEGTTNAAKTMVEAVEVTLIQRTMAVETMAMTKMMTILKTSSAEALSSLTGDTGSFAI